jgi:hypothetical protein
VARQRRDIVTLARQQRGDAEVEQLHSPLLGHEDVRRLEIAMDDEIAVGVRHRRRERRGTAGCAVRCPGRADRSTVDALAAHVFEDEIRLRSGLDAGVEQPRNVRMLQAGEHAALARSAAPTDARRKRGSAA